MDTCTILFLAENTRVFPQHIEDKTCLQRSVAVSPRICDTVQQWPIYLSSDQDETRDLLLCV